MAEMPLDEMEMKDVILSGIVSIIAAAITGWISGKQAYRKEIKKSIYEEKQKLYIEIFSLMEQLQYKPYLIYNYDQFIQPFRQIKAKTNLYASREVLAILIPFNNKVMAIWNRYTELFESEEANKELQNRQEYEKEINGTSPDQTEWEFQQEADHYMETNLISKDEVIDFLNSLSTQIRSELKTE